jgi:aminopeptidase
MNDPRSANLAKILVNYSTAVRPGDWVVIHADVVAMPLARETARQVLAAGGNPSLMVENDDWRELLLAEGGPEQLAWLAPTETLAFEQADALIRIAGSENTRALAQIAPERQRQREQARGALFETMRQRSAEGSLRWVYTESPCAAFAQDAEMSLAAYEDFVYAAAFADQADPLAASRAFYAEDDRRAGLMAGHREVVVRGPHVELRLSIAGRTFVNAAGRHNAPDGEIYTGPVEDSVNGWIRFSYPAVHNGREVDGVEMAFRDGEVVTATASKNQPFLLEMLAADPGARYLGEFAIGTNDRIQRFTRRILYDEKIGGTIHVAIGSGYPETGSRNRSRIHWDFICDMRYDSEIVVDGEVMYRNGSFVG